MEIDVINIAATFGAAIAGSWFGARATNAQTKTTVQLAKNQWKRERAFELIGALDEYLSHSFRKELDAASRDQLSRKALALTSLVVPDELDRFQADIKSVKEWHHKSENNQPKPSGICYSNTEKLVSIIREKALDIAKGDDGL